MKESANVIKTIKVKKEMNFRELMEYILENDIRDREFRCNIDDHVFRVCEDGIFEFYCENYDMGETYEVEVEEEITEDMKFENLVEVTNFGKVFANRGISIERMKTENSSQFYILLDGELVKIWQRGEENV